MQIEERADLPQRCLRWFCLRCKQRRKCLVFTALRPNVWKNDLSLRKCLVWKSDLSLRKCLVFKSDLSLRKCLVFTALRPNVSKNDLSLRQHLLCTGRSTLQTCLWASIHLPNFEGCRCNFFRIGNRTCIVSCHTSESCTFAPWFFYLF